MIEEVKMVEQFRFPKSKKCRMRKKWAKNPDNYRVTGLFIRCLGISADDAARHPLMSAILRKELDVACKKMFI